MKRGTLVERTFQHEGRQRSYLIHVPVTYQKGRGVPLLFVFHGGGGNARQIARFTDYERLSNKHGFIVVYPQSIGGHWNDGRRSKTFLEHDKNVNDVAFVIGLIESLKAEFTIDSGAVFATGLSNGGIFSHRLGIEQARYFAAIAPVIGGIAEPLASQVPDRFTEWRGPPVSVLIMNGTEDPFVPYEGGVVKVNLFPRLKRRRISDRGKIVSTETAVRFWLKHNGITAEPKTIRLPDVDPHDSCWVEKTEWSHTAKGVSVVLYKIVGGGHTYPGGSQYLPERVIGRTCRDFQASDVIWAFLNNHTRAPETRRRREKK